ncbi:hypothetical protein [Chamaesiphon sp. VAR_48_metabat_135_sub]|uniref:hypothetical protein n=1 Tax=Chamaesiphon sp. VAR_48_metabat_135_sub TaxID=2964699 RepID=UPI00286D361E|nr:hypothetical protein [Chamaesiphon sp. VAR_48_metabat_135_sub]
MLVGFNDACHGIVFPQVLNMIRDRSKYRVGLIAAFGLLACEFLSISAPSLAQTRTTQCSIQQIENNIKNLPTNPTLVDTLAACGSDAVPILLRYLEAAPRDRSTELLTEIADRRLLVIMTLGQMGSRASSSTNVLLSLMGNSSSTQDLDKVILYTLWQINDESTRNSIISSLLKVVQNPAEMPEKRVSIASKIDYLYRDILKTKILLGHSQIITPALNQIILKTSNNSETRKEAFLLLKNFDFALAQKMEKQYPNIVNGDRSGGDTATVIDNQQGAVVVGNGNTTNQTINNKVRNHQIDRVNTDTSISMAIYGEARERAINKIKINLPAVCRIPLINYPVIRIVFEWKCR